MPKVFPESLAAPAGRFAIVVSRYNETITARLLDGAVRTLMSHGTADQNIEIAWVPGAFEIPLATEKLLVQGDYLAVLCLGVVIRGETTHDQHINRAVSLQLCELGIKHQRPVLFGVLTCETLEQAIHRSGGNVGNKGVECAEAALAMVNLLDQIDRAN
ncbi:MAG TPA: 6,7-dimethyl-8-ribityllumazine synthase [Pirellulales bacterium]|jgi:6,7-dimethyl-8-ribityllumazine synthase|nr:6,7-dimethyl-8-ribityllumazine synthase [Pirellulales bacterium]